MRILLASGSVRIKLLSDGLKKSGIGVSLVTTEILFARKEDSFIEGVKSRREFLTLSLNEILVSERPDVAVFDSQIPLSVDKISPPKSTLCILLNFDEPFYKREFSLYSKVCTGFLSPSKSAIKEAESEWFRSSTAFYPPALPEAFHNETKRVVQQDVLITGKYNYQKERLLSGLRAAKINSVVCGGGWHRASSLSAYLRRKIRKKADTPYDVLELIKGSRLVLYIPFSETGLSEEIFDSAAAGIPIAMPSFDDAFDEFDKDSLCFIDDGSDTVERIRTLLDFNLRLLDISSRLSKMAQERFTPEARAKQFLEVLNRL
jgi:glycosyltransferase involved in cell wall biosynthesis